MAGREVEWKEVQGIVLKGYRNKTVTRYYLLEINDPAAARAWLNGNLGLISFCGDRKESEVSLNLAFTLAGLAKMGIPKDALDTFPWDFRDGMTSPLRRRILGDFGPNDPNNWCWGHCDPNLHVLVIMYGSNPGPCQRAASLEQGWGNAFAIRRRQPVGRLWEDAREHFGFVDGLSQPAIDTSPRAQKQRERGDLDAIIQPGEFILGYVNERGQLPVSPSIAAVPNSGLSVITNADRLSSVYPANAVFPRLDFGRNGSFLVYRQLQQDVFAFADLVKQGAGIFGDGKTSRLSDEVDFRRLVAAKIIGRWDDGTSLTLAPNKPPDDGGSNLRTVNNFGYVDEDRYGLRCPIGAHVRRGNPRDTLDENDKQKAIRRSKRHRLLRRGRIYGERTFGTDGTGWKAWDDGEKTDDGKERGTHFVAINASIESQFEFVQQTWMNTPFFGGLTDELDPLVGMPDVGERRRRFTIQGTPVNRRFRWTKPLVTVRGGAYFFLPSQAALKFLASDPLIAALQPDNNRSVAAG
jgi:deferrochelatase/peroxidase EfeB